MEVMASYADEKMKKQFFKWQPIEFSCLNKVSHQRFMSKTQTTRFRVRSIERVELWLTTRWPHLQMSTEK